MLSFIQFILNEVPDMDHVIWYIDNHGVKAQVTKDQNYVHPDMWVHDKLIPSAVHPGARRLYDTLPRGRAIINHKGKRITHTDYGWGRSQEVDDRLKKKYPDYVQAGTEKRVPIRETEEPENHFGFLRPGKPPIRQKPWEYSSPDAPNHESLAIKHGYNGVTDALSKGLVRYYHDNRSGRSAGYEFHDTPTTRKLVSDHLGSSGGFRSITMDIRDPKTWKLRKGKNEFSNVEAAQRHLGESDEKAVHRGIVMDR